MSGLNFPERRLWYRAVRDKCLPLNTVCRTIAPPSERRPVCHQVPTPGPFCDALCVLESDGLMGSFARGEKGLTVVGSGTGRRVVWSEGRRIGSLAQKSTGHTRL